MPQHALALQEPGVGQKAFKEDVCVCVCVYDGVREVVEWDDVC